ncbi:hypothetical protein [Leptospira idonii]|uniref:Uncharacterized protein n=1 Tax=Leptospira idonii TaxID=1193500 RepID=A0A4R9M2A5_9LEPT|nr:hypothetical protein [Leptospira idonii]TGN20883.1 hypothetical protein EHS15_01455 [Leptospira idonii]
MFRVFGFLLLFVFLNQISLLPLRSFGSRGPYTHREITFQALEEFARSTKFELNAVCAESFMQGNLQADTLFPDKAEYHCDNSDFRGCSINFRKLVQRAEIGGPDYLFVMGRAAHILQDFYAHSNWAENVVPAPILAPIEEFRHFLVVPNIQSGMYPYSHDSIEDQYNCFVAPEGDWKNVLAGASHACMNKDSNFTIRGGTVIDNLGKTYHEFAAELAIAHTVEYLMMWYKKKHPSFMLCLSPRVMGGGCNHRVVRGF